MKLEMMNERILVKPIKYEERRDSSLYIPEGANDTHKYFQVLEVGPGMVTQAGIRIEPKVTAGDTIIMLARSGTELLINGELFKVVSEREIIAKVLE